MTSIVSMDVPLIVEESYQGETSTYPRLASILAQPTIKDDDMLRLIHALIGIVDSVSFKYSPLLCKVKNLDWRRFSDQVIIEHGRFLVALVRAKPYQLESVATLLAKKFLPDTVGAKMTVEEYDEGNGVAQERIYTRVHEVFQNLIETAQMDGGHLMKVLSLCYPYFRRHVVQIRDFNRNLLKMSEYVPHMRSEILGLIIEELSKLDTMYGQEGSKLIKNLHCDLFEMDIDSPLSPMEWEQQKEFAEKLDCCLVDLFAYLRDACYKQSGEFRRKGSKKAYATLRSIFQHTILPLRGSGSVPFLWFYVCSTNEVFANDFLDMLWSYVVNPTLESLFRCNAACYMASFLSRAKFVPAGKVIETVSVWSKWLNEYVRSQDGSVRRKVHVHAVFYAVCSATFYVVAFRCKELTATKGGVKQLKSLNLNLLVSSSLNPLKFCDDRVLSNFANFARNYKIAFCHEIMERNRRIRLRSAMENYGFDIFFPFDPCLLKRCSGFVSAVYNDYDETPDHSSASDNEGREEQEEAGDDVAGSCLKNNFKYGSSPGFKHARTK